MNPVTWLTAKRVRVHGLLLAVCLWTVYAVEMSTPGLLDRNGLVKGTDFLHFYTLGTLALQGRGDLLYDMRAQAQLARRLVPLAPDTVYVPLYGPQISILFEPFARLPYGWALAAWLAMNVLIFATCCYAVWKTCPHLQESRWIVLILILAIAFPGFFHLLAWGQTSGLALLCFTLAYLALRRDQRWLAGLAIGSLVFKPQLGVAAAIVFLLAGEWKLIAGGLAAASIQLAVAWLHYGTAVMRAYLNALIHVREVLTLLEPRLYQTHSLRSFWSLLLPWPQAAFRLYVVSRPHSCGWLLAKWSISGGPLFGAIVRHHSCVPPFDRVRPGNSCAGVPVARRLGPRTSRFGATDLAAPLRMLSAVLAGAAGADYALAVVSSSNDSSVVDDLACCRVPS